MTTESATAATPPPGPWNPGIRSEVPTTLRPLVTIFRPEHSFTSAEQAYDLHELTGLELEELAILRPERLAVHEVLIRVTADLSVPDGSKVEDLGINFRSMTDAILRRCVEPHRAEIVAAWEALRTRLEVIVATELRKALGVAPHSSEDASTDRRAPRLLDRLFRRRRDEAADARPESEWEREERVLGDWKARLAATTDPAMQAALRALIRAAGALRGKHGRIWGNVALLTPIVAGIACNEHGSEEIGKLIAPWFLEAARAEGYALLPSQADPVVMNTKGASASGKSTMRPHQKNLAGAIGVRWSDFALISPDIWRKYLLDYGSLGAATMYAGSFTGRELAVIDHKLDRYMARKAETRGMSHLLIDRFRFDSFAPHSDAAGSNLLTRFGHVVYMFFMITPPHETVVRSWKRGLEFGRYKAVDDLLAHNIEAYGGIPGLFFTWALRDNMKVHYEFLDNSVPFGETPRSVAFGWNGEMNILDVPRLIDVDRFRRIDVNATTPEAVYRDSATMAAAANTHFLVECVRRIPAVNLVLRDRGRIYARFESGQLVWTDDALLAAALDDPDTRAGLMALVPGIESRPLHREGAPATPPRLLDPSRFHTFGQWGTALRVAPPTEAAR